MFLFEWMESNPIADWVQSAVITFYLLEMVHVIGITLLFGSLAIMDLRLIGLILRNVDVHHINDRLRPATWIGFALAAVTGTLMFLSSVSVYVANTQFWAKMAVIALAGINMLVLEMVIAKRASTMTEASYLKWQRFAGATSLVAWMAVIALGRWIGFTKSLPMTLPDDFLLML